MTEAQPQQEGGLKLSPYQNPMHNFGSAIITLTNPENELKNMELAFRSQRQDYTGAIKDYGEPLMNELGINSVVGQVQAVVSRNAIMSDIDKYSIPLLIDFLGDTLAKDLMLNRNMYDIKNVSARDKIFFQALTTAFLVLRRGYEGGDRRFWKGSQQDVRQTIVTEGQKGFLSKLNPFSKR